MEVSHKGTINPVDRSVDLSTQSLAKAVDTDKIKANGGKFTDSAYRTGIMLTGVLPFSSRGVISSSLLVPVRLVQSAGPGFTQKMKDHMDKDWGSHGIKDSYKDLSKNTDLNKAVVKQNIRYAAYMDYSLYKDYKRYQGKSSAEEGEQGVLLFSKAKPTALPEKHQTALETIDKNLQEMGFKLDNSGNYYSTKTGTMFSLIYDTERNEVVACFKGLGSEVSLNVSDEERSKLSKQSLKAAGGDWFGGIPAASRQAIEIGKMLKDATAGTNLTPVMVGHSHGGGLAQTAAASNGLKAIAFNPRPMGAGTRRYIGESTVAKNAENITVFSSKGDFLTGNTTINHIAAGFEKLIGIPVPRSVGTGYRLPNPPEAKGVFDKHNMFYEGCLKLNDEYS